MSFEYSEHWIQKLKERPEIREDMIEYCLFHSSRLKDRLWSDRWNAIAKIPPSNRILKVVYKTQGKTIKIITAYWLDKEKTMKSWYDKEEDILNLRIEEGIYWKSIELPNGIVIDISKEGAILSFEIFQASKIFSKDIKKILEHTKLET